MDLGLEHRVALVAGGTSGLGFAVAAALAAEGCAVAVCGRDRQRLDRAVERLRGLSRTGAVTGTVADVTDDAAARAWVEQTAASFGALHIVVTNTGGPPPGPVEEFDVAAFRRAADVAVLPHIGLALAALPHLRAAGWGRILLIASETVRQPIPRYGLSGTVRPALLGFARTLAHSLGDSGVTVNVLAPGYHDTEGLRGQWKDPEAGLRTVAAGIPAGRVGRPADFGAAAAFLAGDAASFITGTTLLIDGGATRGI
jgi:3-oxoacyl-[acyl-carrier protein] reductase